MQQQRDALRAEAGAEVVAKLPAKRSEEEQRVAIVRQLVQSILQRRLQSGHWIREKSRCVRVRTARRSLRESLNV